MLLIIATLTHTFDASMMLPFHAASHPLAFYRPSRTPPPLWDKLSASFGEERPAKFARFRYYGQTARRISATPIFLQKRDKAGATPSAAYPTIVYLMYLCRFFTIIAAFIMIRR